MKTFQTFILGFFGFLLIGGGIAFATFRGSGSGGDTALEPLELWGSASAEEMTDLVEFIADDSGEDFPVSYREIREADFDQTLIEALASGRGPDLILLPQDSILRHQDKLAPIPYESFSERAFRDTFIEEGELYLSPAGALAIPFSVDPLVLYWNRTLFSNAGLAQPPRYWDEMQSLVPRLTEADDRGLIARSALALGEFGNVAHAKEIFSALLFQAGSPITERVGEEVRPALNESDARANLPERATDATLRFYTEFADPTRPVYSWNRSLPNSRDMFLAGDLALYLGFASELFNLQERNPNLNFDVALLPQVRGGTARKTYGRMLGVAALAASPRRGSAFSALGLFAGAPVGREHERATGLPPVRRDLLAEAPTDAFRGVFHDAALIAAGFLDPARDDTAALVRAMIENVTSGRARVSEATSEASRQLEALLKQN